MRVYISADIEGITGLVSWSQCSRPDGNSYDYQFARRMMTHDVNAAVRGARKGGATDIVIKDSHGNSKNLLIDELESGVHLVSGHGCGTDGMMEGIDAAFDAAMLVGYHGMAGTEAGVMEHTITGGVHHVWVNGQPAGEIGLSAGVAGKHGVPLVFISSDAAGCKEADELIPGITQVAVKTGLGRFMSRLLHPSVTREMIETAAQTAVEEAHKVTPFRWAEPTHIKVEFNRSEEADMCAKLAAVRRVDAYSIELERGSYTEAHRLVWNLMSMSFQGLAAQS